MKNEDEFNLNYGEDRFFFVFASSRKAGTLIFFLLFFSLFNLEECYEKKNIKQDLFRLVSLRKDLKFLVIR